MTQRDEAARDGADRHGRPPDLRAVFLGVAGALLVALLIFRWTRPEASEPKIPIPEVQVRQLTVTDLQTTVEAHGTVIPKTTVAIVPEVSGKIIFVHSELTSGGIIRANEMILQIDSRQYELDVRRARAAVTEAQVKLDTELARARLTDRQRRQDYQETELDLPSALAELQVRQARAALEWAQAELAIAELKLERTTISLPFDVLVTAENVDLGRHVQVGQELASVCGIEAFEIKVAISGSELTQLDILNRVASTSDTTIQEHLTSVDVRTELGGRRHIWPGIVSRTGGQIDPVSQTIPIIVEVSKPLETVGNKPPLFPGALVEVLLPGTTLSNVIAVPRSVIHDDDTVWLVEDDQLRITKLDIAWTDDQFFYVTSGLSDKALVVTSSLESPVDGMHVQVKTDPAVSLD